MIFQKKYNNKSYTKYEKTWEKFVERLFPQGVEVHCYGQWHFAATGSIIKSP